MRIVFAGTPEFAARALDALISDEQQIVAVYTQPDRPAGRGMKLTASAVKQRAIAQNIPVLQPPTLKTTDAQAELAALKPDLMIVAAYGLILPQAVLDIPHLGCLNIHASLLPRWRGAAPIQRALLAGDAESGVCIMRMEAGLDTGAVLLEARTPISAEDTAGSLHDRLAALGAEACVSVVRRLARGERVSEVPQPDDGVTYAHKISVEEAEIDWSRSAEEIARSIRAFNPVPGAWTTWRGEKLKIWSAVPVPLNANIRDAAARSASNAPAEPAPGSVVQRGRDIVVFCGPPPCEQALTLLEIQKSGGKRMAASVLAASGQAPTTGEMFSKTEVS